MAKDAGKRAKYARILTELDKFNDPSYGQRLDLIAKKLAMSKQALNYYLQKFQTAGVIERTQEQPYAIYSLTGKGQAVKKNLIQSEQGIKTMTWRYHNLIMGYKILYWGNFKFLSLSDKRRIQMNNWTYQRLEAPNGLIAHVQDTGLLKIYGPKICGPDGEELRIKASTMVQEAARYFIDHYDLRVQEPNVLRKGQKELLSSEQLAKLVGRVKTEEFWIDASGGDENLESYDDSFAIESLLHKLEESPMRLKDLEDKVDKLASSAAQSQNVVDVQRDVQQLVEMMRGFLPQQLALSNAVNYSATAIKNLQENSTKQTEILERMTRVSEPSGHGDRGYMAPFHASNSQKSGLEAFTGPSEPKNVEIRITRETPLMEHEFRGARRKIGPFYPGAKIWLPEETAETLIKEGYAERIQEDKARAE